MARPPHADPRGYINLPDALPGLPVLRKSRQGSSRSNGSSRSQGSWADIVDDFDDNGEPKIEESHGWDLSSNAHSSSSSLSLPRNHQEPSGGASSSALALDSGAASGSRGVHPKISKLRNRGLTKEQAADSDSTSTRSLQSGGDQGVKNVVKLSASNIDRKFGQQDAGDMGAAFDDSTSNSGVSFTESSQDSSALEGASPNPLSNLAVPSLGSARHELEACKPCLFVHTEAGCQKGALCDFCHYPHKRKSKPRPCKGKRDRYRRLLTRMEGALENVDDASNAEDQEEDSGEPFSQPISQPHPHPPAAPPGNFALPVMQPGNSAPVNHHLFAL